MCIPIDLTDCYDGLMNFSNPILICDENEEFRILIRDMLIKNGFFHVLEASSSSEAIAFLQERNDFFVLLSVKEASREMEPLLNAQKNFVIFSEKEHEKIISLTVKFGVDHIMTYPFHSRKLMDKINSWI